MFGLEYQEIINNIRVWGYPLMLLLMIAEGPIATLGAAFLASMGFFNVFIVLLLSILGDIVGDIILYFLGFFSRNGFFSKLIKVDLKVKKAIKKSFKKRGSQIIFFTKATTGLCYITFFLAGANKINFKKFVLFSFLGGIVWSSFIVLLGYFFGETAERIEEYIKFSGWFIFILAFFVLFVIMKYKKNIKL